MEHAPPVARLALAFVAGVAWAQIGAPFVLLPLPAAIFLFLPIRSSDRRIATRGILAVAVGAVGYAA